MFENKTETEARKEILELNMPINSITRKRSSMRETAFRMRPACTTAKRW